MRHLPVGTRSTLFASIVGFVAASFLHAPSMATIWTVRPDGTGDFPTIQAAVSGASDGDVIQLTNGTFSGEGNRDVDFMGKSLTVQSQSGDFHDCIIDCGGTPADPHRAFVFEDAPDSPCVIEGLTFQAAEAPGSYGLGGAIYIFQAPVRIVACRFRDNRGGIGAGVFSHYNGLEVEACLFERNHAEGAAALYCLGDARIERCTFAENLGAHNGGAVTANKGLLEVIGCTFYRNQGAGSSIFALAPGPPGQVYLTVENTVMAEGVGPPIDCIESPQIDLFCCDLFGNIGGDWVGCISDHEGKNGNFSEDPLFCHPQVGDFRLSSDSPCAPERNPECGIIGAWPVGCGPVPTVQSTWGNLKWEFSGPSRGNE